MAARDTSKKLEQWIKALEAKHPAKSLPNHDELLDQFIHYMIFYINGASKAKRAFKGLLNDEIFSSWNEIRVAKIHEIEALLDPARTTHSQWLARVTRGLLEGIWRTLDRMSLDKLREEKITSAKDLIEQIETRARTAMHGEHEERRGEPAVTHVMPPWAPSYLLTLAGIDTNVPWDPHTERVTERLKIVDSSTSLARRKKQLRSQVSDSREALHVHHLFVEHGRTLCLADNPKCAKCPLIKNCDYAKKDKRKPVKKTTAATKKKTSKATAKK